MCRPTLSADKQLIVGSVSSLTENSLSWPFSRGHVVNWEPVMCSGTQTLRADWRWQGNSLKACPEIKMHGLHFIFGTFCFVCFWDIRLHWTTGKICCRFKERKICGSQLTLKAIFQVKMPNISLFKHPENVYLPLFLSYVIKKSEYLGFGQFHFQHVLLITFISWVIVEYLNPCHFLLILIVWLYLPHCLVKCFNTGSTMWTTSWLFV